DTGNTPEYQHRRIANARTKPVNYASGDDHSNSICELKCNNNIGIIRFTPREFILQNRFQQAYYLPVEVIDGSCKENQGTDRPSKSPFGSCSSNCIHPSIFISLAGLPAPRL